VEQQSLTLSPPTLAEDNLGFFRWARVAGKNLVTNDAGDWAFLTESDFNDLLAGRVSEGHAGFEELQRKGFLRDRLDLDALASRLAQRNRHVGRGPHLHVVTLTLRCSQECGYCEAARQTSEATDLDMIPETAEKVVNLALQSTSPSITFELEGQGGEPLLNFDVLRHIVEYARASGEKAGKAVHFNLLSNLSAMTEERAEWLISNEMPVCTSLDGPARLHDAHRAWKHGSAHAEVTRWIDYFNRRYAELGRDSQVWHVNALLTVTRQTLTAWREVVDEYVARGLRTINLRPLNAGGFARGLWPKIGYSAAEYLDFYRRALDYILELNRQNVEISEGTASILVSKILGSEDPGLVDVQSPCGAGTAQIAYNVDGGVFPCGEARVVDALGEPIFKLGNVQDLTIEDVVRHPTVRAIAAASLLDAQPQCADCWNKPFCGISPVYNFMTQGDLFGQRHRSFEHKERLAVSTRLFELLASESDGPNTEILKRWATKPRLAGDRRALREAP
jgi:uncharacterized protein